MTPATLSLIIGLLIIKSIAQNFFVLYLLQFNEYRFDRFLSYLKRNYRNPILALPFLTLLAPLSPNKLPRLTAKSIVLVSLMLLVHLWFYVYFGSSLITIGALLLTTPLLQLALIAVIIPIEWCIRQFIYSRARAKISQYKGQGLVVVGITGSYGKSTTKYFLNHILSTLFNVMTTQGSVNTPLGLSRAILTSLSPQHQILIVEMGAYKKGEIAELASIVKPDIAIITGISDQHIELFGGQENIIEAKSELLASLQKNSLAVINGESEHAPILPEHPLAIVHFNTQASRDNLKQFLDTSRIPDFLKPNLEAALVIAQHLNIPKENLIKAMLTLPLPPKTMDSKVGYNGAYIIDDSYSSNTRGVLAAIDELFRTKHKKHVIVMPCLIELSEDNQSTHRQIGKTLSEHAIEAVITTPDCYEALLSGYDDKTHCHLITEPGKIIAWLKANITKDSAVLVEGRVNALVVEFLANN